MAEPRAFVPLSLFALFVFASACHTAPPIVTTNAPCAVPRALRSGFEVTTPAEAHIDATALATMLENARASDTDALVILRDGRLVLEEYFGHGPRPIFAMSAAKSVASLAIAALQMRDPSFSLDERVSTTFPVWAKDPRKALITIRQLMTHTSGLARDRAQPPSAFSTEATLAAAPIVYDPGTDFRYNNAAVDFLSVLVFAKTKYRLDDVLQRDVFGPMGVRGAYWQKDIAGHPMAAGELSIEPIELVKIGQLMLQDGVWDGKRILPEHWVAEVTRSSQSFNERYGTLWWLDAPMAITIPEELLARWKSVGISEVIIAKVRTLIGRSFTSTSEVYETIPKTMTKDEYDELTKVRDRTGIEVGRTKLLGPVRAWRAAGWMGQYLVIIPSAHLVALRMHVVKGDEDDATEDRVSYGTFTKDARALVGDRAP